MALEALPHALAKFVTTLHCLVGSVRPGQRQRALHDRRDFRIEKLALRRERGRDRVPMPA